MDLTKAYKMVFEDMVNSGCDLWVGKYDAKHGNKHFMYGVGTVMEHIAYEANEGDNQNFLRLFAGNMTESEDKVL